MTADILRGIESARLLGQSDEDIFEHIKSSPKISQDYESAISSGKNPKEVDKYLKDKFGLKTESKNLFQNIYNTLTTNPFAYGLEKIAGRNPISENIQEAQTGLVSGMHAGILSAPHEIAHFPENMLQSMQEFHGGDNPGFFEEENVGLRSIVEPAMKGLDWVAEKTGLKDLTKNLYTFEQAKELLKGEDSELKTHAGKAFERIGAGAGTAGPVGAVVGAADYLAELTGMSPEQRGVMALMIAKVPKSEPGVIPVKGKLLKSEPIRTVNDLAAKMIAHNPDDLNMSTLKAAYDLNIPLEEIPLQALYKNGLPNLMEGISQNSFLGSKRFDNLLGNFTFELTSKVEDIIGSTPIDTGMELITSKEHLGEPKFNNTLPEIFENAAPQLEIPKHETGKIGANTLKSYEEGISEKYKSLYDKVYFTENDVLSPKSSDYVDLFHTVQSVENKLKSKGFQGAERKEALGVINELKTLFNEKNKPIKLEDVRKNIIDLNKKISFENPTLVNLLEPVASKMRQIMEIASETTENLNPLLEANKLYREKSQFFQDPIMKSLMKMTDEQFYKAIRSRPSYLKKFSEFAEKTGQTQALNDLKGKIMADVLEKPLKASTPKELASSITDKVIQETRELEPFYPELKGLSKSLQEIKKMASQFVTPDQQVKSKLRQKILEDIMTDSEFNETLQKMNSPKGISIIREILKDTPQGRKLMESLERKKVEQVLYDGVKKQELELSDLSKVFDKPRNDMILKTLLSDKNYQQAKNIAHLAKQYEKGSKTHSGLKNRFALSLVYGVIPALYLTPATATLGISSIAYLLRSENFKKSLITQAKKQYDIKNKKPKGKSLSPKH